MSVCSKPVTVSSKCSYSILSGNNDEEDDKLLKEFIRIGIHKEISEYQNLKCLGVEIALKYLPVMNFKEYFTRCKRLADIEITAALTQLKDMRRNMTKGEYQKMSKVIRDFPKRSIPKLGSYIFQFLNNCFKFLKNQIPKQLSEGFSFHIDANSVKRLLTEETKRNILGNITREDQFIVRISHSIWSENEQVFALESLQNSLSSLRDDNSIQHWISGVFSKGDEEAIFRAVKDYISSNNEFQTTSPLLQQFLSQRKQQDYEEDSDVEEDSDSVEEDSDFVEKYSYLNKYTEHIDVHDCNLGQFILILINTSS